MLNHNKPKDLPNVFNFSGGKTSAYMTLKYYQPGDLVIFCDTGREHEATYKFIKDFEEHENIPVTKISYYENPNPFSYLLERKKYKVIPNIVKRFCTIELKVKTAKRYLRSIGVQSFVNYIGFRADENRRIAKTKKYSVKVFNEYPLHTAGITKQIINDFWSKKNYNLEIPAILGNCTLCFMKGKSAIITILTQYPELADVWIEDEKKAQANDKFSGHTYFKGVTIEQLRSIAQNNLFKDYDLDNITPSYSCKCSM